MSVTTAAEIAVCSGIEPILQMRKLGFGEFSVRGKIIGSEVIPSVFLL